MKELRADQTEALESLREGFRQGAKRIVMQAPTGFGKTVLAAAIVENARKKNKRVLFTVPAISLISQTVEMLYGQGIDDVGVIQAQHEMTDWSQPIQVASIQTLQKRTLPKSDVVMIDECFAAGTMVETPNGVVPIEAIKVGDAVYNATGIGFVAQVFKQFRKTKKARLSNGQSFRVTEDHPFFTGKGWQKLETSSILFSREGLRVLRRDISTLSEAKWQSYRREDVERAKVLLKLLRQEERESSLSPGGEGEVVEDHWEQGLTGPQEGFALGDVGVEDYESKERACFEPVFNLHVTGHPSYFAGGVLVHNCHRWFKFYEKWLRDPAWQAVPFIGLSATPWTKGLGAYYDKLVIASTTESLIERGLLSPFRVFAPAHPDLKGVRTVAGDYHEGDLEKAMNRAELVADVVETWIRLGEGRPTLCFAVDRAHAKHIQQKFEASGIPCGYQDAYTKDEERREIKRKFHNGEYKVVANVNTLSIGVDWDVRAIIMARPTKSKMLFVQAIGRGLRTAEGKTDLRILDHSDNHLRLGFVTDIDAMHTSLHNGKGPAEKEASDAIRLPKECPKCSYLKPPKMAKCPNCGFLAEAKSATAVADGELEELQRPKKKKVPLGDKLDIYAGLLWVAKENNYQPGWVAHAYREIFDVWPRMLSYVGPKMPSDELISWLRRRQVRHQIIKNARAKKNGVDPMAMTRRDQEIIASVAKKFVPGTLCTEEDMNTDWR